MESARKKLNTGRMESVGKDGTLGSVGEWFFFSALTGRIAFAKRLLLSALAGINSTNLFQI